MINSTLWKKLSFYRRLTRFLALFAGMKAVKLWIPNALTLANLACGFMAILSWKSGHTLEMVYWVLGGAILDFLDGGVARLLNARSTLGKELDSLADMVTFGVVPGIMAHWLISETLPGSWNPLIALLSLVIPICAAIRLGVFNVDTSELTYFKGVPTPANTLFWAALLWGYHSGITPAFGETWMYSLGLSLLSCLQVAFFLPVFSLKDKSSLIGLLLFVLAGGGLWLLLGGWSAPFLLAMLVLLSFVFLRSGRAAVSKP